MRQVLDWPITLDHILPLASVADRASEGEYPAAQGGIGNRPPVPHGFNQIILRYNPVTVLHQMPQNIEDFGSRATVLPCLRNS